jgi:hypothetical protein
MNLEQVARDEHLDTVWYTQHVAKGLLIQLAPAVCYRKVLQEMHLHNVCRSSLNSKLSGLALAA